MELSVVIPVYNEFENINPMIEKLEISLNKGFVDYEIIFINDGSTDGSKELLEKLKIENHRVVPYHFTKNNGQSAGIAAGFEMAKGDLVLMMDGDLQTDPEDIYELIKYIPEYDMVNGKRATREDGLKRKLASTIGNGFRNLVTGDNIADTGCPLKLFKNEVVKQYRLFNGMHRFLPTLAKYNGFKVIEVPVRHYDRLYGTSKYKVFGRATKAFLDVFAVRWMRSRTLKYRFEGDR
ncbi:MAG: glycosyltransferase family 2 protein [Cetobacterium sp.]|uniref:glycosyltransferase family 2 protein n=1 Tax=unclassified Cetobacterium TaxID=2630983 RepID=UPI00163BEBA8|nr:glycosyltransferase family 2 protein [Cetobacterium sp. 2A]MBC2856866.1 glycosyltransferase family 2 protein [Cetobacterium sp. 2A]